MAFALYSHITYRWKILVFLCTHFWLIILRNYIYSYSYMYCLRLIYLNIFVLNLFYSLSENRRKYILSINTCCCLNCLNQTGVEATLCAAIVAMWVKPPLGMPTSNIRVPVWVLATLIPVQLPNTASWGEVGTGSRVSASVIHVENPTVGEGYWLHLGPATLLQAIVECVCLSPCLSNKLKAFKIKSGFCWMHITFKPF